MRVGFVTCVQLGLHCLEAVHRHGGRFELVITLPDDNAPNKSGRVHLDEFCARTATPLLKARNINDPWVIEQIRAMYLDWLLIIGWSQIARRPVLEAARLGTLGMHPTLLPLGRGRAAIPWAILKQLPETGVTLFKLDEGVDSGPIAAQTRIAIAPDEDAGSLYQKVSDAHGELLVGVWPALMAGEVAFREQDHSQATLWPGRKPEDGDLGRMATVAEAERLVRAVARPYPGAFVDSNAGRVRVWRAVAQQGAGAGTPTPSFDPGRGVITFPDGPLKLIEWELEARDAMSGS
jgi:methionyl-tRNA formyltransferase